MYELFLTAAVKEGDFEKACAILQGLTWMAARHSLYRVLYFATPPQYKGLNSLRSIPRSPYSPLYSELNKQLTRQAYVLQVAYEVFADGDFGSDTPADFNASPATLRWVDFPDPLRDSPVTQRKRIDIPDQRNVYTALVENKLSCQSELIHETYSFVRGNVEFSFNRYYRIPPTVQQPQPTVPASSLPAFLDLQPVDPAQKWVLHVKLNVAEENQPEKIKKATEELMGVKAELDKLFDFKVVNRRMFDTRVA